jgi:maltooligosyltrehalose trehalohydrolase
VIGRAVRRAARGRSTVVIIENEPQDTRLIRPLDEDGYGLDAAWNDDFHHTAMVCLTGRSEAYYTDYRGTPQEFISCAKRGYLFQGQRYIWQKKRRGASARGLPPEKFVNFIQNHDQIANSGRGLRVHELCGPALYRTMTAVLLLSPGTPMLFQGQEFAASSPFHYFADHTPELARLVHDGRRAFMKQFRSVAESEIFSRLPDPADPMTFARSKLDFGERHKHAAAYALHKDLLRIRREDPIISLQGRDGIDGAVLSQDAFVLRYFSVDGDHDRLLVVNLGIDLALAPAPEPLLAPCNEHGWVNLWSSEDLRYGGSGTAPLDPDDDHWHIPGRSAVLLAPFVEEPSE